MRPTWDETFINLCKTISERSKDSSSKLGAVIVGPDKEIRSTGYNCFPRNVNDNNPKRLERPLKYFWIEHAERNAIYNAARVGVSLKGCKLYCNWIPCADCARAIIQVGIIEVIAEDLNVADHWVESFLQSALMFKEADIILRTINDEENVLNRIIANLAVKSSMMKKNKKNDI